MKSAVSFPLSQRDALIALNAVPGISTRFPARLLSAGVNCSHLFVLSPDELITFYGLKPKIAVNVSAFESRGFVDKEQAHAQRLGVRIITLLDADYPLILKVLSDPPAVLYVKGVLPLPEDAMIAMVGARQASLYGLRQAEAFAAQFAHAGVGVISGMAYGIDAAAHRGVLKNGGRTFAVLGTGIDVIYPLANRDIYEKIPERGGIFSEFPLGTIGTPFNFPRRNRIVSGLSRGVLVVEARARSGALITAQFALEQGRDVYALPGPVDSPLSRGPHALIAGGAKLVLSVEDILEDFFELKARGSAGLEHPQQNVSDPCEGQILDILKEGPASIDTLAERTGLSVSTLMAPCFNLQIGKHICEKPGKIFELMRR